MLLVYEIGITTILSDGNRGFMIRDVLGTDELTLPSLSMHPLEQLVTHHVSASPPQSARMMVQRRKIVKHLAIL